MLEFRRGRRYQAAADLCREFTKPDMARSVTLLKSLPDGLSSKDMQALGPEYEEAALIIGMTFETMGLLVHKNIASFQIVQELTGGLLLMMWRKIERWAKDTREEQNTQRFGEWVQWLAERMEECESELVPAYSKHADWKKHLE